MTMKANVYAVGIAVIDFIFAMKHLPRGGDKFVADDARIISGGCAANAAVAVARLGGVAELAARLGDDLLADWIEAELRGEGVGVDGLRRSVGGRSSFSSVYLDAAGERQIVNYRGANLHDDAEWITVPPATDVVLTDTRWTQGMVAALEAARRGDLPGIVDAETIADPTPLSRATHVAFSRQGLLSLAPGNADNLADALAEIRPRLSGWACVTDGANGVFFTAGGAIEHIPANPVTVRDSMAAGDIWHGAFALRLAEGGDEAAAITFANAAAALKCANGDGRNGCPTRRKVDEFLARL